MPLLRFFRSSGSTAYAAIAVLGLAAWLGVAFIAAPWLIRQGHAGESIEIVNRVFSGRDVNPVAMYLGAWRRAAMALTVALIAILTALPLWNRFADQRRTLLDRAVGGAAPVRPGALLQLSFALGLAGGLAEALWLAGRQVVVHQPASEFHIELMWMAPLSAALAALCVGAVLAAVSVAARGGTGLWKAVFIFGFLAVFSLVQSNNFGIHPAAEAVLSLGVAAAIARAAVAQQARLSGWMGPARAVIAALLVASCAFAFFTLPRSLERRAQRSLGEPAAGLPNIVLIIMDTARQASFSLYGYHRATSPGIDSWAGGGAVFDRAIATSSWTLPTHGSVFTGEYNHVMLTGAYSPLRREFQTIAEVLAARGYATAGFAANPAYTTAMSGLAQGFAYYADRDIDGARFVWSSWLSRVTLGRVLSSVTSRFNPAPYPDAESITSGFLAWMERRDPARPFFAFLNYFDAHEPYETPHQWRATFGPVPAGSWAAFSRRYRPGPGEAGDDAELGRWVNRYDAAIAYIDDQIGLIRERLEARRLADSTIVIITSDHGEMWGEQGEIGHSNSLFLPAIHVPLVMILPGRIPAGVRVAAPVSVRDIPRTIGDIAGVAELAAFPGASLAHLWGGGPPATHPPPLAELEPFGTNSGPWWAPVRSGPMKSLIVGDLQYIVSGDSTELLFDLAADPDQAVNLAGREGFAPVLDRFRASLDSILRGRSER